MDKDTAKFRTITMADITAAMPSKRTRSKQRQPAGSSQQGDRDFWADALPKEIESALREIIRSRRYHRWGKRGKKETAIIPLSEYARPVAVSPVAPQSKAGEVQVRGHWRIRNGKPVWVSDYSRRAPSRRRWADQQIFRDMRWQLKIHFPANPHNMRLIGDITAKDGGHYSVYADIIDNTPYVFIWDNDFEEFIGAMSGGGLKDDTDDSIKKEYLAQAQRFVDYLAEREIRRAESLTLPLPGMGSQFFRTRFDYQGKRIEAAIQPVDAFMDDGIEKVQLRADFYHENDILPSDYFLMRKDDWEKVKGDNEKMAALAKVMLTFSDIATGNIFSPENDSTYFDDLLYAIGVLQKHKEDPIPIDFEFIAPSNAESDFLSLDNIADTLQQIVETGVDLDDLNNALSYMEIDQSDFVGMIHTFLHSKFGIRQDAGLKLRDIYADESEISVKYDIVGSANGAVEITYTPDETHINLLEIFPGAQGNGVGTDIMRAIEETSPSDFLSLDANITVGGYAWALLGFDFSESDKLRMHLGFYDYLRDTYDENQLKQMIAENDYLKALKEAYDAYETGSSWDASPHLYGFHSWDIATFTDKDGYKIGKEYLLGSRWAGIKNLWDENPGEDYYRLRFGEDRLMEFQYLMQEASNAIMKIGLPAG